MKCIVLATILALAAVPALAQTATAPGSLGGNQIGTGAVEVPGNSGGSGPASASAAITGTPAGSTTAGSTTTGSTTAGASAATGGSGSSGGGGGHGGGIEALCLSAKGTVTSVDPDEFGLDCPQ